MEDMSASSETILEGLDDAQMSAVTALDGPVRIIAGAGAGKTRTVTRRIAYACARGDWDARKVLAVTFSVKAAAEMRARLQTLAMFELIAGKSPYKSPTDMGVNMAGNCIVDDAVCREASRKEILRRYFKCLCEQKITGTVKETERYKLELLMNQADLTVGQREVEKQAHARSESTGGAPAAAIELPDGTVVTGKTGPLLGAAASALMNALKVLAGIPQETDLVSAASIEPIQTLKTNYLGGKNPRLHTDEILIALSSSAASNEQAAAAMHQLPNLKGCDVHSTVLLSGVDTSTLNRLGMYLTCDPVYEEEDRKYHKQ